MQIKASNVIGLGDTHGIRTTHKRVRKVPDDSVVIQVGDGGIGFDYKRDRRELGYLADHLRRHDKALITLRGNHDNPACFNPIHPYNKIDPRLMFVEDYTLLVINNTRCLFVGGGVSLDRCTRTKDTDWWNDETVKVDLKKVQKCDVLFCHIAAREFPPVHIDQGDRLRYWNEAENEWREKQGLLSRATMDRLLHDVRDERDLMETIVRYSEPTRVYYGHHHESYMSETRGIFTRCLAKSELVDFSSWL